MEGSCSREDMWTQKRAKRLMTTPLRQKGHKRWLRPSPKGSRHRGRGPSLTLEPGPAGYSVAAMAAARPSPQHRSALLWGLGQGSWGSARARLEGGTTLGEGERCGSGLLLQGIWESSTWQQGQRSGRSRGRGRKALPMSNGESYGALGSEGALHPGLTSLLAARHSKAWLIQRTAGSADELSSVKLLIG